MSYRIGVDIGGSFTDFAVLDERDHSVRTLKVLSRPDAPGTEVVKGLGILAERDGIAPQLHNDCAANGLRSCDSIVGRQNLCFLGERQPVRRQ